MLGFFVATGLTPNPALAEEEKPTAELAVSALSQYVARGIESSRDSIIIQPSMTVCYRGFSVNTWANLDTDPYADADESSNLTETDLALSYEHAFGKVILGGGYIYYGYSSAVSEDPDPLDSQEVFASIGLDVPLCPTVTVYREITGSDEYDYWYGTLEVSHSFEISDAVSLELSAMADYLKGNKPEESLVEYDDSLSATDKKYNNFLDGLITASLPISFAKYFTLTPTISYMFPLCDECKNYTKAMGPKDPEDNNSSFVFGGITFAMTF
jgi:uncharacterized protein (TIGR02001 family)